MLYSNDPSTTNPGVLRWATRVPGDPARWVLDLSTMDPAAECPEHGALLDDGYCRSCIEAFA